MREEWGISVSKSGFFGATVPEAERNLVLGLSAVNLILFVTAPAPGAIKHSLPRLLNAHSNVNLQLDFYIGLVSKACTQQTTARTIAPTLPPSDLCYFRDLGIGGEVCVYNNPNMYPIIL